MHDIEPSSISLPNVKSECFVVRFQVKDEVKYFDGMRVAAFKALSALSANEHHLPRHVRVWYDLITQFIGLNDFWMKSDRYDQSYFLTHSKFRNLASPKCC